MTAPAPINRSLSCTPRVRVEVRGGLPGPALLLWILGLEQRRPSGLHSKQLHGLSRRPRERILPFFFFSETWPLVAQAGLTVSAWPRMALNPWSSSCCNYRLASTPNRHPGVSGFWQLDGNESAIATRSLRMESNGSSRGPGGLVVRGASSGSQPGPIRARPRVGRTLGGGWGGSSKQGLRRAMGVLNH